MSLIPGHMYGRSHQTKKHVWSFVVLQNHVHVCTPYMVYIMARKLTIGVVILCLVSSYNLQVLIIFLRNVVK